MGVTSHCDGGSIRRSSWNWLQWVWRSDKCAQTTTTTTQAHWKRREQSNAKEGEGMTGKFPWRAVVEREVTNLQIGGFLSLRCEADHERVGQRPRLTSDELDLSDLDPDFLLYFATARHLQVLACKHKQVWRHKSSFISFASNPDRGRQWERTDAPTSHSFCDFPLGYINLMKNLTSFTRRCAPVAMRRDATGTTLSTHKSST